MATVDRVVDDQRPAGTREGRLRSLIGVLGFTQVGLGAVMAIAVPVLAFAAIQYGLHSINHLIDVGDADPGWLGPFNLISLLAFAAVLLYALREAARTS